MEMFYAIVINAGSRPMSNQPNCVRTRVFIHWIIIRYVFHEKVVIAICICNVETGTFVLSMVRRLGNDCEVICPISTNLYE